MAPGSGLLSVGVGVVSDVGQLNASLSTRINESVSLFASGSVDTTKNWQAMTGLKVEW
jgi:hypothetical protein|tara:strand:- start:523 stop:696 length:174 start_codon:yes stop_codon:yes gene_type:complete